jgi:hypothetical protein
MPAPSETAPSEQPRDALRTIAEHPLTMLLAAAASALVVLASAGHRVEPAVAAPEVAIAGAMPSAPLVAPSAARADEADLPDDEVPTCGIPDRGSGPYGSWQTLPLGRMMVPTPAPAESYDLLLHFHGGEAMRRVVAPEMPAGETPLVLAAVDAGVGSQAYAEAFAGAQPLEELLGTVGAALAPARLRYLVLSGWSAGYGALREILREHPTVPNALVLLDSLHSAYGPDGQSLVEESLAPFVAFARRAQSREAVMVLTHSEIRPPGYASTSEVASHLIDELGGKRSYAGLLPLRGVEAKTRWDDGLVSVRGYTGASKEAHCAHVAMLGDILRDDVLPALP